MFWIISYASYTTSNSWKRAGNIFSSRFRDGSDLYPHRRAKGDARVARLVCEKWVPKLENSEIFTFPSPIQLSLPILCPHKLGVYITADPEIIMKNMFLERFRSSEVTQDAKEVIRNLVRKSKNFKIFMIWDSFSVTGFRYTIRP